MGKGAERFGYRGSPYITDIKDIKVPNWVNEFPMFRSPSGAVGIDDVRKEYKGILDQWLKGGGKDLNEFRRKHGIVIDERGKELLTSDWKLSRKRFINEQQQTHSGKGGKSEAKQIPREPSWNWQAGPDGKPILKNKKGDFVKFTKLEGHHVVGLRHLGPFFEGASDKQAFELRQRILNETRRGAVGTDKRNWAWLTDKQHDLAHKLYGYATDEEIADPKNKGLVFYDLEKPGMKGRPSFSEKFLSRLQKAPFDRPKWQQSLIGKGTPAKNIEGLKLTKGDYLIDYLNLTDEAYEDSIAQARKARPNVIPEHATKGLPSIIAQRGKIGSPKIQGGLSLRDLKVGADKVGGKFRKGDAYARLGIAGATGDVIGGTMAGGQIAMQTALQNPKVQRRIAAQIAEITAKRGAGTVAKMVPGLDILISGKETMDYLAQGKLDQAGIAAVSGAIGWIPIIGDAASASLDIANTGIDIARLDPSSLINNQKTKATQPDLSIGSKRFKFNPADKLSFRSLKGF